MNFAEYRASRLGTYRDIDGYYGPQCWDQFADYCQALGVPYPNCTKTSFAQDIWTLRQINGMLTYFDEKDRSQVAIGDVCVFQPKGHTPDSHVGTAASGNVNGWVLILGQNQGGNCINEVWLPIEDLYPTVFRLKQKKLTQLDGNVQPVNDMGLKYQAHTQDIGWREWIHDGMIAGSVGACKRLEALHVDTTNIDGGTLKLKAKAHIENIGWVTYDEVTPDTIIGTRGKALRMEAIELDEIENTAGKKLYYQVHLANTGWTGKVPGGYATGTVGLRKAIEAIRIWLE